MTRFFCRLALALLAEWFCWRIATPAMRYRWALARLRRGLTRSLRTAAPKMERFYISLEGMARGFSLFSAALEETSRGTNDK